MGTFGDQIAKTRQANAEMERWRQALRLTAHFAYGTTHSQQRLELLIARAARVVVMVSRGPVVHHVRRTSNPFLTTSSGIVGINLNESVAFEAPASALDNQSLHASPTSNDLKAFMYQTTSQALGVGVQVAERSMLSQRMDKKSLVREVSEKGLIQLKTVDVIQPQECALAPEDVIPPRVDTRSISEARHDHPMYATSNRDIGAEKAQVKVEIDRKGRPNTFTTSFNGCRFRDFGLNTAITKSRVCDQLDKI